MSHAGCWNIRKPLEKSVLLAFTLRQLASDSPMNRLIYYGTVPLGLLENGILRMQDHCEMLFYICKEWWQLHSHVRHSPQTIDWNRLFAMPLLKFERTLTRIRNP